MQKRTHDVQLADVTTILEEVQELTFFCSWSTGRHEADNRPRGSSSRDRHRVFLWCEHQYECSSEEWARRVLLLFWEHTNEVQRYLQDPDKTLESLKAYSMVKSLFLKYNSMLPSSAPVEQLFSQLGLIFSPHRNHMTDEQFEQTLLLRYNCLYKTVE